jgi:2-phospho-L-lactate guanylyltransferase
VGPTVVLVPVKAFGEAKRRLAPALNPARRARLARRLATDVVAAAAPFPVAVVCDDRDVADWARALGALVIWEPGRGLNGAVADGVEHLRLQGAELVAVSHGDLAAPDVLASVVGAAGAREITLVPDVGEDGTNVLIVPASAGFRFSYGPGSFRRHLDEATRLGLACTVVRGTPLAVDVDLPGDLAGCPTA